MKFLPSTSAALLALASLAACATGPVAGPGDPSGAHQAASTQPVAEPSDADSRRAQLYREHAGEPISGFLGNVNDWTSLDEHSLAVWTGPNRGYLLEVAGPCIELPWAQRITFSNGGFGRINVFDDVIVLGRQPLTQPCTIREIRPLDAKALKQAERAARQARKGA